jgi:hypothetical protein
MKKTPVKLIASASVILLLLALPKLARLVGKYNLSDKLAASAPAEPVLRDQQSPEMQKQLAQASGKAWAAANYPDRNVTVACDYPSDPYSTSGWAACNIFLGEQYLPIRCSFDLTGDLAKPGTCE